MIFQDWYVICFPCNIPFHLPAISPFNEKENLHWSVRRDIGWGHINSSLAGWWHVHFWERGFHKRCRQSEVPYLCGLWDWTHWLALPGWQEELLCGIGQGEPRIEHLLKSLFGKNLIVFDYVTQMAFLFWNYYRSCFCSLHKVQKNVIGFCIVFFFYCDIFILTKLYGNMYTCLTS